MIYKVILDTNIYIASNYLFQNASFSALKERAASGKLELLVNSVIEGEVETHINREVKQAANELLKAAKHPKLAALRSVPEFSEKLTVQNPKEWVRKSIEQFQELLEACKVKRIPVSGIDVEKIVLDYFQQNPPFEQGKPNEFKDAIAVASIVREVKNVPEDVLYCIVSGDKGFRKAIEQNLQPGRWKFFSSLVELTQYFAVLDGKTQLVEDFFDCDSATEMVCDAVKEVVDSATLDVEDADLFVDDIEVVDIDDIEYEMYIISIDADSSKARIAVEANCKVKVYYKYTDENESFYDKENQAYLWESIIEREDTYALPIDFVLDIAILECTPDDDVEDCVECIGLLDTPERIDFEEDWLIEREILADSGPFHDEYDPDSDCTIREHALTICPDCGTPIGISNDGGNGFCINCGPNH